MWIENYTGTGLFAMLAKERFENILTSAYNRKGYVILSFAKRYEATKVKDLKKVSPGIRIPGFSEMFANPESEVQINVL